MGQGLATEEAGVSKRFAGRTAFITGAATGFGKAFATALSREGASVVIADIALSEAEQTATELSTSASSVIAVPCDVADHRSVTEAIKRTCAVFGGVDLLINNAARHLLKYNRPFAELDTEDIQALFDVNVMGIINCTLACKDSMGARGGGAIVNMSSLAGYLSSTPYGVTKVTARALTVAFATELAPFGIRVNGIAPTITTTESVLAEYDDERIDRTVERLQLIKRRSTMDDVTNLMLFLCSDEASFITGETVRVTGGGAIAI
jgi:NAD(P)-dependent dehydrogenase (short-subunit alcohol dehydrogenase family)